MNSNIPKHWVETTLPNICKIETGKWDANHAEENGQYRFYTCAYEFQHCNTKRFSGDCIILPGNGANVGEVFFYSGDFDAYQRTYVLSDFKIDPRYSFFHMLYKWREINKDKQFGSATNFIRIGNFNDYVFEIPPLNEQKRIVEKLDTILPKVKNAKARLENIPKILKKFRQSVLADACSGKLTEEWREGKELPEWEEVTLKAIADIKGGITKDTGKQKKADIEVPYLRVANVQRGHLNLSEIKTIKIPKEKLEQYLLKHGDILLNEGGDPDKLGRGWIWESQIETCSHQNHVFRARLFDSNNQPKYVSWYANTVGADFFFQSGKQTTGLASINKTMISNLLINLPPIEEQHEIVRRVEKLFAIANSLEEKYKTAIARVEKIEQSVLAKAFRGELVAQDPNDEPAENLLKRILDVRAKDPIFAKLRRTGLSPLRRKGKTGKTKSK
ncbi:MAG TPA: restriction endonuclease subunit S [bacterium]|nr:restriction endonuclease subunit S [bacterium]HRQ68687.1 restriction endonuclease subunit S [bacterium]